MGTRPEAIKLCPLILELRRRSDVFDVQVCSTGQHRAMLDNALEAFSVKPDFDLDAMRTGQTAADLTGRILRRMDEIFEAETPELVLVQGDTTSAFSAALAAFHRGIPIGHIEAGLRTYHMHDPFPEEFHRQAISLIADYHFAPTVSAKRNLLREGKHESRIYVTGNTVVDAMRLTLTGRRPYSDWNIPPDMRMLLFTAHRKESIGEKLCGMLRALRRIVEDTPDLIVYYPVHHNPEVRRAAIDILKGIPRIRMIEPPEIVSFHHLLSRAYLILTDSGGIQEEASVLGIPTVVMRYSSERTEGMRAGVLKLAGCAEQGIYELTKRLLAPKSGDYELMKRPSAIYGDGNASVRIADILMRV